MALTFLGIFILIFPYFLLFYTKNTRVSFLYIFSIQILFHLTIALLSQYFYFFNYQIILLINIIATIAILLYLIFNRNKANFNIKINWKLAIAVLIVFFELFSVNFLYTGTINTINGHQQVKNFSNPYPYFSDEWAGVSIINHTIQNKNLATVNPLVEAGKEGRDFSNIFIAFYALLAEIILLINIPTIFAIVPISILTGILICYFVYLFLKTAKVNENVAIVSMLTVPWIVNSAKLPGIWYLFPFILGAILLLVSLVSINLKQRRLTLISSLSSLFIYPPFIVLVFPLLFVELILKNRKNFKKISENLFYIFISILFITVLIFILQAKQIDDLILKLTDSLIRITNEGTIPHRYIWQVVPAATLPFAIWGIFIAGKNKYFSFFTLLLIGLTYWISYHFIYKCFIIDYARISAFTSYLIIISFGLGLNETIKWIQKKYNFLNDKIISRNITIIFFSFFIIMSLFYTRVDGWKNIKYIYKKEFSVFERPIEAPANNYLNKTDLELFKNIQESTFISIPWKGLVIGAATKNYPVITKASTLSTFALRYETFEMSHCYDKDFYARYFDIDYAYIPKIDCPKFFQEIGRGEEGLYLYKHISDN